VSLMKLVVAAATAALLSATLVPTAGSATAATAAATSASTGSPLAMSRLRDMLVDEQHGKIYVAGATTTTPGKVVVTDLAGRFQRTITGITDARALALSTDGSQVLVADGDGITLLDAETATVTSSIPTGAGTCPSAIAPAAGKVWVATGYCYRNDPNLPRLAAVDLTTHAVTTGIAVDPWPHEAELRAVPGQPDTLVGLFNGRLVLVDVTGGETPGATIRAAVAATNLDDLAVTTNGSKVLTTGGSDHRIWSTASLKDLGSYATPGYPEAIAVRNDGLVAASTSGSYRSYLSIFKAGSTASPYALFEYAADKSPVRGGLRFGTSKLYAVEPYGSTSLILRVLVPGPPATVSITTDKSLYLYGATAMVVAKLGSPTTKRTLSIYARAVGGSERLIKTGTVNPESGKLVARVAGLRGNVRFRVAFAGDDRFNPASRSVDVKVKAKVTLTSSSTSMSGIYHRLPASPTPAVYGRLFSNTPKGCVRLIGYRLVNGAWSRFDSDECATIDSEGRFGSRIVGFGAGSRLKVTARFQGSDRNVASDAVTYYVLIT